MVRRLLWIGAATAVLGACSHRSPGEGEAAPAVDQGWTLTIINHHWLDVSVYVMTDGQRTHVGLVTATRTESFEMPARTITGGRLITLVADPVGGPRSVQSERLAVQGGQNVKWTLEHGLERSTVAVY
jgi:hypothetical protein